MQIYEVTRVQSVNEIDFKKISSQIGKALIQAPVKALGNKVGVDLTGDEKTKSATELKQDIERYFGYAKYQLYQGTPDDIIISELIGKYGANADQANKALQAARQQFRPGLPSPIGPDSQSGARAFATMANQLGQSDNTTAATAPVAAPDYGTKVGPGVKPQMTATPTIKTSAATAPVAAPDYGTKVGPGVKPQMTATPTIKTSAATAPTSSAVAYTKQQPMRIGGQQIKPNDPLYSKIQKQLAQQKTATVEESLDWSPGFDPGRTLYFKIESPR